MGRTNHKKEKEAAIIKGCINGSAKYQEMLYTTYSPLMFGICLRYAKEYHQAEDILQEGFIKVFKNIMKYRGDGSFEGWLKRIFVNTAIEHYRRSVSMYPIIEVENNNIPTVKNNILESLAAEDLMGLINKLAHGYKTIFSLYVIEGYSHKEIAQLLSISEGTSKSQLARARYILQNMIEDLRKQEKLGEAYG